jgi:holo-[acyl-carrier protein] synthase
MTNLGVDIVAIDRIESILISDKRVKFLNKIFSENEIAESQKRENKTHYFSGRFAAKEAVKKALSCYKESTNQSFKSIEVLNSKSGKPYVVTQTNEDINISISHDGNYAVAFCIIDK